MYMNKYLAIFSALYCKYHKVLPSQGSDGDEVKVGRHTVRLELPVAFFPLVCYPSPTLPTDPRSLLSPLSMKFQVGFLLLALQFGAVAADKRSRHAQLAYKRQNILVPSSSSSSSSSVPPHTVGTPSTGVTTTVSSTATPSASTPSTASSVPATASIPAVSGPGATVISSTSVFLSVTPTPAVSGFPQLTQITSGMPSQATSTVTATYTPGAQAPISGAPPLPSACKCYPLGSLVPFLFLFSNGVVYSRV